MGSKTSKLAKNDHPEDYWASLHAEKPPSYTASTSTPSARFERWPTPTVILEFSSDHPEEILLATSAALADLARRGLISGRENTLAHLKIWKEYNKAMRLKFDMGV